MFPIAGQLTCHTVHIRTYSLQIFSVIVDTSKPTSQYNRAKVYDCTIESEAVEHASCVEVTSFIPLFGDTTLTKTSGSHVWKFLSAVICKFVKSVLCKFLSVRYSGVNLYWLLCNTIFISVRIPDYRGVRLSGVSLNTLST